ncbi:MAG: hypothetical protein KF819_39200, partial [Labilithrix sp.]|nr:hypothetical protein [Labilithrix sp.]
LAHTAVALPQSGPAGGGGSLSPGSPSLGAEPDPGSDDGSEGAGSSGPSPPGPEPFSVSSLTGLPLPTARSSPSIDASPSEQAASVAPTKASATIREIIMLPLQQ